MTKLEQAARQALEALEEATSYTSCESWSPSMTDDCNKAITALREALDGQTECKECGAKQAQIDRLMLEYCPDEMTPEQMQEWGNNQRPVEKAEQSQLADASLEPVARHICNLWVDPITKEYVVDPCDHPIEELIPAYNIPQIDITDNEYFVKQLDKLTDKDVKSIHTTLTHELWARNIAPVRTKDLSDYEIAATIGCSAGDIEKIGDARAVIAADREKNK